MKTRFHSRRIGGFEHELFEIGKLKKGGAPRVVYFEKDGGTIFVAAGVEKRQHEGIRELGLAKNRARKLLGGSPAPDLTPEYFERNYVGVYTIELVPVDAGR